MLYFEIDMVDRVLQLKDLGWLMFIYYLRCILSALTFLAYKLCEVTLHLLLRIFPSVQALDVRHAVAGLKWRGKINNVSFNRQNDKLKY